MISNSLARQKRDWEDMASLDPLWAILSEPDKQFGRWDSDAFFREGEEDIRQVLAASKDLGYPRQHNRALDFGCGVGRLTRALSANFLECCGVDISPTMIEKAKEMNQTFSNCKFLLISEGSFAEFSNSSFDFIITRHVLQHLPGRGLIRLYIAELVRLLGPGGLLVLNLPNHIPYRNRLQGRRRLYSLLRFFGFKHQFLYEKLTLNPIRMNYLTERDVKLLIKSLNASLLRTTPEPLSRDGISLNTYYICK